LEAKKVRNQGRIVAGIAIIGIGLLFLVGTVFRVNVWAFCLPIGLIVIGAWMLLRPSMVGPDVRISQKVLGDIRRKGAWDVVDEEIWLGVGDVRLDLTEATIPTGEPKIQIYGFVGDVDLIVPQGIGVSVSSWAFFTDGKVFGKKHESFVMPLNVESDDYSTAERRVHLETYFFVTDLTVKEA
jgi:predicted membrane protein